METKELARLVVLMLGLLDLTTDVPGDDAGTAAIRKELRALGQLYAERVRLDVVPMYHTTPRGAAALDRFTGELTPDGEIDA